MSVDVSNDPIHEHSEGTVRDKALLAYARDLERAAIQQGVTTAANVKREECGHHEAIQEVVSGSRLGEWFPDTQWLRVRNVSKGCIVSPVGEPYLRFLLLLVGDVDAKPRGYRVSLVRPEAAENWARLSVEVRSLEEIGRLLNEWDKSASARSTARPTATPLSTLVNRRLAVVGGTLRGVAERGGMKYGSLQRYTKPIVLKASLRGTTMIALAKALDVAVAEVKAAVDETVDYGFMASRGSLGTSLGKTISAGDTFTSVIGALTYRSDSLPELPTKGRAHDIH